MFGRSGSVNTLDRLFVFSSLGRLHWLNVYKVPSGLRQTKARSLNNLLSFKEGEEARLVLPLKDFSIKDTFVITVTKKGTIKKSSLSLFPKPRSHGVNAVSIDEGDFLQDVQIVEKKKDLLIYTQNGSAIRINSQNIRPTGRVAKGVKAIDLRLGDSVVSLESLNSEEEKTYFGYHREGLWKTSQS